MKGIHPIFDGGFVDKKSYPENEPDGDADPGPFSDFIDSLPEGSMPVAQGIPPLPLPAYVRIPEPYDGLQFNFCKNTTCANFGIPAEQDSTRGRFAVNTYIIIGGAKGYPLLRCNTCREHFPIKSNKGIVEELERMRREGSAKAAPSCPNDACSNHAVPVSAGKASYSSFGVTAIGSPRWKCKACGKTFSAAKSATHRQRATHKNKLIFTLLVNKVPMRRIVEIVDIGPKALYGKIDFLYEQCRAFLADRESRLPQMNIKRLYLGVDRQDYVSNWTTRNDRRNTVLSAVSSVDNETGYCFATHVNFDPDLDPAKSRRSPRPLATNSNPPRSAFTPGCGPRATMPQPCRAPPRRGPPGPSSSRWRTSTPRRTPGPTSSPRTPPRPPRSSRTRACRFIRNTRSTGTSCG